MIHMVLSYHFALVISITLGAISSLLSLWIIYKHLRHYNRPSAQIHLILIIFMVPVYAVMSCLSIALLEYSSFFKLVRDLYESFVILEFYKFLLDCTGERANLQLIFSQIPKVKCVFRFWQVSGNFFLTLCKRMIYQYVIVKVIVSIIFFLVENMRKDGEIKLSFKNPFLYFLVIQNVSLSICLFFMLALYQALEAYLTQIKCLSKFLCIKFIFLFVFWNSLIIVLMNYFEVLKMSKEFNSKQNSVVIQNLLMCVELLLITFFMLWAFSHKEFVYRDSVNLESPSEFSQKFTDQLTNSREEETNSHVLDVKLDEQ